MVKSSFRAWRGTVEREFHSLCVPAARSPLATKRSGNVALLKRLQELNFIVHSLASVSLDGKDRQQHAHPRGDWRGNLDAASQMLGAHLCRSPAK